MSVCILSLSCQMKKIFLSIVSLCYLAVTCGVVVNFHYCMDRLASTELFAVETDKCGRCGMEIHESNGCCRDEVKIVKMTDDQNKTLVAAMSIPSLDPVVALTYAFISAPF